MKIISRILLIFIFTGVGNQTMLAVQDRQITVFGSASFAVEPDVAEITAVLSSDGDSAAIANEGYTELRERVENAFDPMVFSEVTIHFQGYSIQQSPGSGAGPARVVLGGGGVAPVKSGTFRVEEEALLSIQGIDKMKEPEFLRILNRVGKAVQSNELRLTRPVNQFIPMTRGMQDVVRFRISDPKAAREAAYELAMKDASNRATKLAKIMGGRVGIAQKVREQNVGQANSSNGAVVYGYPNGNSDPVPFSTNSRKKIVVQVTLEVTYLLTD